MLVACIRSLLLRTARERNHLFIVLSFFLLSAGATFYKIFPSFDESIKSILSFIGLSAICLMLYALPSFHICMSAEKPNKLIRLLPFSSILFFTMLAALWNTPLKFITIQMIYGALIVEIILVLIPDKKDRQPIVDEFWKKMLAFASIASLVYLPFYIFFDVILIRFVPRKTSMEFFPIFLIAWGVNFITLTIQQLIVTTKLIKAVETQDTRVMNSNSPALESSTVENRLSDDKMKYFGLSKREQEAVIYLARGLSYKEIAEKMFVSDATIKTHIARAYIKTNSNSKVDIINKLMKN